jgi:hypothetical protein
MSDDGGKHRQAKDRRTTRRPLETAAVLTQRPQEVVVDAQALPPIENGEPTPPQTPPAEAMAMMTPPRAEDAPTSAQPPRQSLIWPAVLALLVGGGAGLAGGLYGPGLLGRTSVAEPSALQRLQGEVASLANRPAAPVPDALNQRMAQTETALRAEIQALTTALNELRARPTAAAPDMTPLVNRLGALEQNSANRSAASLGAPIYVVTMGLTQAVEQGRGFASELAALEQFGVAPVSLAALKPFAASGLPTMQRLVQNFAPIARQITEASTPKADGLSGWAQSLVKVRAPGGDALATIDAALRNGDVSSAVTLLEGLPEAQKALAAPFVASLRARIAASEALLILQKAATAGLHSSAPGKPAP